MSVFRRVSLAALRSMRPRGGHDWPNGSFFSEGSQKGLNGFLFGEVPPAPGRSRKWESWEAPWYATCAIATAVAVVIAYGKDPETLSIYGWAAPRALRELAEEDKIYEQLKQDPGHLQEVRQQMKDLGKHFDEYFDTVQSRYEFEVLKKKYDEV